MAKSTDLNFTQNINNQNIIFASSDLQRVIFATPNSNGSNLTTGERTFTANTGTGAIQTGGGAATWTANVTDSRVVGPATITSNGGYLSAPSDVTTNPASVDSGSSNATWTLTVGILKTIYTASANDSVVKAINVASTDSAARVMTLWLSDLANGNDTFLGAINIPVNSGVSGTVAAIDLLGGTLLPSLPYDANGKRVLPLKSGWHLKASVPAVTAGRTITVEVIAEDY
jgi:hypothetical protein